MKFILHSVFWGNRHTDLFINYALPSLLGDKSIDNNIKKYEFQFNIFCSSKSFKEIKNHKIFQILKSKMNVRINTELVDEKLKIIDQLNNIKDIGGSLNQGHVRINNICIKRPKKGLSPKMWPKIINKKSKRNYKKDDPIIYE